MGFILVENMYNGKPDFYFGGYNKKYSDVIDITKKDFAYVFEEKEKAERTARRLNKAGYKFVLEEIPENHK